MNTLAFFNHARRWFLLLWNLILPRVRLLNTWHPMHTWFWFVCLAQGVEMLQNCLNAFSPARSGVIAKTICWLLLGIRSTKDGSSLSMVQSSCCIALVGLSLAGAVGTGKKAHIVRSKVRVTKFFVTESALVSIWSVHAGWVAWEGVAATEATMVERGGLVIDPRRLM